MLVKSGPFIGILEMQWQIIVQWQEGEHVMAKQGMFRRKKKKCLNQIRIEGGGPVGSKIEYLGLQF